MTIDKPYPDHIFSTIRGLETICGEMSDSNETHAKDESFKPIERVFFRQTAAISKALTTAFVLFQADMILLNHLYTEKSDVAKKEDIEKIRADLTKKVNETLGPIKQ